MPGTDEVECSGIRPITKQGCTPVKGINSPLLPTAGQAPHNDGWLDRWQVLLSSDLSLLPLCLLFPMSLANQLIHLIAFLLPAFVL